MTDAPTERDANGARARLRRRKVVQWGLAYAAGACALLQVIGFAADAFHWPDVIKQFSMLGVAIGLPVALTLAWYHGDRGEQSVSRAELAVLTLLLFVGGGVLWLYGNRTATEPAAVEAVPMAPGQDPVIAAADPRPSIAALRKSLELEPDAVFTHEHMGEALLLSGDLDGALIEMQRERHDVMRRLGLAFVYAAQGKREAAQQLLAVVGREHPDFASPVAAGYARLGMNDEAFEWLDRALHERDGGVLEVRAGPLFQPLRNDPRYVPLLRRVGLADEQVAALDFDVVFP